MRYLQHVRNATLAVFAAVMVTGWSTIVRADPEGSQCVAMQPYFGYWVHDHEFQCVGNGQDLCDAWCDLCWGAACAYVNYCEDGDGHAGACS